MVDGEMEQTASHRNKYEDRCLRIEASQATVSSLPLASTTVLETSHNMLLLNTGPDIPTDFPP